MRSRVWFVVGILATTSGFPVAGQEPAPHVLQCADSPMPGQRPQNMECAILIRATVDTLPRRSLMWRIETFSSIMAAQQAQTNASVIVEAAGRIWLMTLGQRGQRSKEGHFIAEVGPLSVPEAPEYELLVAEAHAGADATNLSHTHPGPEAWYVIAGKQCVETPTGVLRAAAGEGMVEPAETPMRLTTVGPEIRDAFFIVVHDPSKPWNADSTWQPKGLCTPQ